MADGAEDLEAFLASLDHLTRHRRGKQIHRLSGYTTGEE
jgi:hypothetical protein